MTLELVEAGFHRITDYYEDLQADPDPFLAYPEKFTLADAAARWVRSRVDPVNPVLTLLQPEPAGAVAAFGRAGLVFGQKRIPEGGVFLLWGDYATLGRYITELDDEDIPAINHAAQLLVAVAVPFASNEGLAAVKAVAACEDRCLASPEAQINAGEAPAPSPLLLVHRLCRRLGVAGAPDLKPLRIENFVFDQNVMVDPVLPVDLDEKTARARLQGPWPGPERRGLAVVAFRAQGGSARPSEV